MLLLLALFTWFIALVRHSHQQKIQLHVRTRTPSYTHTHTHTRWNAHELKALIPNVPRVASTYKRQCRHRKWCGSIYRHTREKKNNNACLNHYIHYCNYARILRLCVRASSTRGFWHDLWWNRIINILPAMNSIWINFVWMREFAVDGSCAWWSLSLEAWPRCFNAYNPVLTHTASKWPDIVSLAQRIELVRRIVRTRTHGYAWNVGVCATWNTSKKNGEIFNRLPDYSHYILCFPWHGNYTMHHCI